MTFVRSLIFSKDFNDFPLVIGKKQLPPPCLQNSLQSGPNLSPQSSLLLLTKIIPPTGSFNTSCLYLPLCLSTCYLSNWKYLSSPRILLALPIVKGQLHFHSLYQVCLTFSNSYLPPFHLPAPSSEVSIYCHSALG